VDGVTDLMDLVPVSSLPHLHRPDLGKPMGSTHVKGTLMTRYPCQTEGCDHILERRT